MSTSVSTHVSGGVQVRRARAQDVGTILRFIRELAEYEREPDAAVATEADLLRDGFHDGTPPRFHVLLAELNGEPVGMGFYFFSYSTWRGRPVLYLEDLYVTPAARGRGAGMALMRALAKEAVAQGCARFTWQVLDWNEPSIAFYRALGARVLREWLTVRLDGEALERLASAPPA